MRTSLKDNLYREKIKDSIYRMIKVNAFRDFMTNINTIGLIADQEINNEKIVKEVIQELQNESKTSQICLNKKISLLIFDFTCTNCMQYFKSEEFKNLILKENTILLLKNYNLQENISFREKFAYFAKNRWLVGVESQIISSNIQNPDYRNILGIIVDIVKTDEERKPFSNLTFYEINSFCMRKIDYDRINNDNDL